MLHFYTMVPCLTKLKKVCFHTISGSSTTRYSGKIVKIKSSFSLLKYLCQKYNFLYNEEFVVHFLYNKVKFKQLFKLNKKFSKFCAECF